MNRARSWKFASIPLTGLLLALVVATPARAAGGPGHNAWTPFGPGGGTVQALAVDPRNPAVVYAVGTGTLYALNGSLFKSLDGGATWEALVRADVMALDPEHPSTIYAGGSGLLRSDDGGETWTDIYPQIEDEFFSFTALAVVPGGTLLAVDISRVLRSMDRGRTWSIVADGEDNIRSILVDPANPRRLYAMSDSGVARSDDGGAHWTLTGQPESADSSFYGAGIALAPSAPKTLYVLLDGESKIFRSDDGAATWHRVGKAPPIGAPWSLLIDPRLPDTIYVGGTGGAAASVDGGRSWRILNTGLPRGSDNRPLPVSSLALAPSRPETLFAGTQGWGVARSDSSGARWRTGLDMGLSAADTLDLQFHPLRPGTLYLFQGDGRSFHSADNGQTWRPFSGRHPHKGLNGLAFDPVDPDLLYGTDRAGTWKSVDGGKTWTWLSPPKGRLAALGPETLIALGCGLQRSTDGGRTWRGKIRCDTPDGDGGYRVPIAILTEPRAPRTAYAQFLVNGSTHPFRNEVFRTQDGGATWTLLALTSPSLFAMAPSDSRILYAFDEDRLLRSVDAGGSWEVVHRDLSVGGSFGGGMTVDPADPDTLYIAADPLLISHDGGATFQAVDAPLEPWKRADRFWTDPAHPGVLYGASFSGGLFVGRFE